MKTKDKVFVVTGAGGGIGGELALQLLKAGAKVAALDLKQELLTNTLKAAKNSKNLSIHKIDITNKEAVLELPNEVIKTHSQVDAVINCAGIIQPFKKIIDLDYKDIDRVMNVNFYGTLYITKAFLPHLLQRPEAHIINVSSMGGFLPVPGQGVYGASKAAVKLLTEALYAELLDTTVRVTAVFPGATTTDIAKNSQVDMPNVSEEEVGSNSLSAAEVAAIIIDGIQKNKPQIYTGKDSKSMNLLYRLNPVYATKLIAKQMKSLLK